jgi:hypothetical protein
MLADDRARRSLSEFHRQWLGVTRLPQAHKLSPAFDEVLVDAMLAEVDALSQYVVLEDDGTLETLLTGSFTLASDPMLDVYGPDAMPDPDTDLVDLDPQRRAGVLTLPAVLAAHSHEGESGPVPRGVLIRQNILCQLLPPPPPDVDNIPPPPSPNQTTRERFEQHSSDPVCAGCHAQIDPLGFGFEHYDELGAWRDVDLNGFSVDASGEILGTDVDRAFDGAVELAQALASSEDVRRCYATQWLRFALARAETEADTCSIDQAYEEFEASDFHVPTLLSALVRTDSFRFRPHSQ